ncbi:pentatricopeptide repeat-containing protein At2g44880-like [Panicum virgatum]|uniref:Pentatricopeptide repeat-containing protein n=1 Tax=Panicum virgatum TaxID=38727 RepID=A0A8T0NPL1_PANVG|nr:pentatricopeptide repeat-containing protein At2g44880-like [Panicum virgatum]XP_039785162.1 pentatricopeptide repeat-containing protein At2g44880-like [Panicum virgatum]XP_039785163.1 pentatricopeptide repeat-containing protein At2g44880-like [Panicum virgatum]XP_039785164.1 pentatricopeptide repeat-containing protein At2g44880-like [Panicum virgatum]XP_039785165.1 pentatricopeptide repeat-containing protein At2g44880-like [Panicum virgatum]XP_039785166.1 pentatricopeptide repeat-containing
MLPSKRSYISTALLCRCRRTFAVASSGLNRRPVSPLALDEYTFPLLLKVAAAEAAAALGRRSSIEGQKLHARVIKFGFSSCVYASTALVDFYSKAGDLASAHVVFDAMPRRTLPSWTAIMVGYARSGDMRSAEEIFSLMPEKDTPAYNAMIDGFVKVGDVPSAQKVFDAMPERNVVSRTCLMHGYCMAGNMEAARELFDAMPRSRNLHSWNVMIRGYCQNQESGKALNLFRELQSQSCPFEPNEVTLVSVIPAITDTGAMDLGRWVHEFARRKGLDRRANVATALIDMYSKCGNTDEARQVFNRLKPKEVTCWNAIINGLAVNGYPREALGLFEEMRRNGISPNSVTMIGVLSACSHGGLVDEGKQFFQEMEVLGIRKKVEHYGCMVDLLGRCGYLSEAMGLIEKMPSGPNGIVLSSLLFACACHGAVDMAESVMKRAVEMEPRNIGNYIIMRNLYAAKKMWHDALNMKDEIHKLGGKKEAGCSLVEIETSVSEFISGDKAHPEWVVICEISGCLQLHMGVPTEDFDFTRLFIE